jgi:hypothetical protein
VTDTHRPPRAVAAFLGATEVVALLAVVLTLASMGADWIGRLLAAFVVYVSTPVAVIAGIFLGIRFGRSASPWGFAKVRQVGISVIVAGLLVGLGEVSEDRGKPVNDPFVLASHSLSDPLPDNRARAAQELVQRQCTCAADLVLPLLQDEDADVRSRAIVLCGQLREGRAVDIIVGRLNDPDYGTQVEAVRSLGEIGDGRAVAPLLAVIRRPHLSGVVADALAKIGDQRAVGPLIDFLEDTKREDELEYRNWVVTSLEKLSGQHYGDDLVRWRRWYEAEGEER